MNVFSSLYDSTFSRKLQCQSQHLWVWSSVQQWLLQNVHIANIPKNHKTLEGTANKTVSITLSTMKSAHIWNPQPRCTNDATRGPAICAVKPGSWAWISWQLTAQHIRTALHSSALRLFNEELGDILVICSFGQQSLSTPVGMRYRAARLLLHVVAVWRLEGGVFG